MCVLRALIKEHFDYGTLQLIDHTDIDPTLAFVAVAHMYGIL